MCEIGPGFLSTNTYTVFMMCQNSVTSSHKYTVIMDGKGDTFYHYAIKVTGNLEYTEK